MTLISKFEIIVWLHSIYWSQWSKKKTTSIHGNVIFVKTSPPQNPEYHTYSWAATYVQPDIWAHLPGHQELFGLRAIWTGEPGLALGPGPSWRGCSLRRRNKMLHCQARLTGQTTGSFSGRQGEGRTGKISVAAHKSILGQNPPILRLGYWGVVARKAPPGTGPLCRCRGRMAPAS